MKGMPYMIKHLRIWFCLLLVLVMLPLAAAQAADHDYQPVEKARISYQLPTGMKATVKVSDGNLDILVDAEETDWGLVLASSLTEWGAITAPIGALAPQGATGQHNIHMSGEYQNGPDMNDVFAEFDIIIEAEFSRRPSGITAYRNAWDFAEYDDESNAIVPTTTSGNEYAAHFVVWDMSDGTTVYEYFMVNVHFTDDSAREVELRSVGKNRIVADSRLESSVTEGAVSYQVAADSTLKGEDVITGVVAPTDAGSYALTIMNDTLAPQPIEALSNGKRGANISYRIPRIETVENEAVSIFWYASDDGSGNPIAVERLTFEITVGVPQPFPRYIDELSAIPSARMLPVIINNGTAVNPAFISADYAKDSDSFDILYKSVTPSKIPSDADLSGYSNKIYAAPPAGAVAYSVAYRVRDTIYGAMDEYYEDGFIPMLTMPESRKLISESVNGQTAALLYQAPLFKARSFSHDSSLTLYTSRDETAPKTGRVIVVYWYDSMAEDAKPIAKEYLIDKTEPFSMTRTTPAYDSVDDIKGSISMPVVVTGNNVGILNLMLVIETPAFSGENCTLYGLHLADADGNKVVIGDKVTIILPYPDVDGDVNAMRFSINHYNESYQLVETYSEDNGLLVRTPFGLAFQTDSFSPFVLSWDDSAVPAAGNLPQTGDTSLPLPLLIGMVCLSVFALLGLRKRFA